MADQDFRCKEDFYRAYFAERQRMNPTPADATAFTRQLAQETKNLFIHCIPETAMEHWPRTPNGPDAAKPNIIERDTRAFVNLTGVDMFTGQPLDERHRAPGEPPPAANRLTQEQIHSGNVLELGHVALRRVHNVDSIKLLEADSQWRMYQRFVDEMFKRDGSMAPLAADAFPDRNPPWTEAQLNTAKAAIPTYQMYPDRAFDHGWAPGTGNCNSGVAQLLRQAGAAERDIKAASPWSFGIDAPDMNIWDPLRGAPDDRPVPGPHIEATSSRGRVLDMTAVADAVQRKYEQYEADLAAAGAA